MKFAFDIEPQIHLRLAHFYGELFGLPPLATKIYALLLFDVKKEGVCFDELVIYFSASKSSISTNINLLLHANLIKDVVKKEHRKRYFIFNDDYIKFRFQKIVLMMKEEMDILNAFSLFIQNENKPSARFEIYKNLLEGNIQNIEDTLKKL